MTYGDRPLVGILAGGDRAGSASARERILATASALFYGVGIRASGIDRIIAQAAVAKATFYHHFPTKDALVCAYLADQHERQVRAFALAVNGGGDPDGAILRVFDAIGAVTCGVGFRGCPFDNAAVEYPDPNSSVRQVVAAHRRWFHGMLRDLLVAAGHPTPDATTRLLVTLRDGIVLGGQIDGADEDGATPRAAVTALLNALSASG